MTPIDIIAEAIHDAECGCGQMEAVALSTAGVAVAALADERIVDHVVRALKDAGWGHDHIHGVRLLDNAQLDKIARTVLASIGGNR